MTGPMAALSALNRRRLPAIASTTSAKATAADFATISKPSGVVSGDLLIIALAQGANAAPNGFSGFTSLVGQGQGAFPALHLSVHYRIANGSEGAAFTTDMSGSSVDYVAWCGRIKDRQGNPEGTIAGGSSNAPDPPNLAPSWGAGNQSLILAFAAWQDDTTTLSSYPSGFVENQFSDFTSGGFLDVGLAVTTNNLVAASADPGGYGLSASELWEAATIAVRANV